MKVHIGLCEFGRGLFASTLIRGGSVILELTGERISLSQAIDKGDCECNPLQVEPGEYIDLQTPAVYANHSCSPNAGVAGGSILMALRDIQPGEEIFYDYSTTMSEGLWTMECRCGSEHCRGKVRDFHLLPLDLQLQYLGLGIVQPFIVRQALERFRS